MRVHSVQANNIVAPHIHQATHYTNNVQINLEDVELIDPSTQMVSNEYNAVNQWFQDQLSAFENVQITCVAHLADNTDPVKLAAYQTAADVYCDLCQFPVTTYYGIFTTREQFRGFIIMMIHRYSQLYIVPIDTKTQLQTVQFYRKRLNPDQFVIVSSYKRVYVKGNLPTEGYTFINHVKYHQSDISLKCHLIERIREIPHLRYTHFSN